MTLDIGVRENSALTATGIKAVIAGATGIMTHHMPIHSTVPNARRTFRSSPAKGIVVSKNSAGPRNRENFLRLLILNPPCTDCPYQRMPMTGNQIFTRNMKPMITSTAMMIAPLSC